MRGHLAHALLVDPGALDALGPARRRGDHQEVALADELLGAGLVEDDARVGEARDREREAARHVGLDHTGDHVDRRTLRRDHEVDADGARHLRDAADARLDVARRDHHQVVELVDDDHDERQPLVALAGDRVGVVGRRQLAAVERGVVAGDVADADLGEHLVAHVHLAYGPVERVRRLLRVRDDRREEVRQVVVRAELDALRVDEDEPHLLGRVAHQQRRDERVDAARLARAGGTGDEHVRQQWRG